MLIGREKECELLKSLFEDNTSDFIAVYGRRRIGKTFLIREYFGYRFTFQHSGVNSQLLKDQLFAFDASLKDAGLDFKGNSKNWAEAFEKLKELVRNSTEKRKVIFIDELSWMDTPRSDFLMALESFWNGWASGRTDILLIVCASATSWMLSKIVHNKGGLYNRLTAQIKLNEFSLRECEEYTKKSGLNFSQDQIMQYYMVAGGVPYYWTFLKKGLSLSQNIDAIFFAQDAPLKDEFKYLYASVFKQPEDYIQIIKALSTKKVGMTRDELLEATGLTNSGAFSTKLDELESCGFIRKYYAFGMKTKNAIYQLIDNFTLFHYSFLDKPHTDDSFWLNQIDTPKVNTWMGLAFERACLKHVEQIKKALGISGVLTEINSWSCRANKEEGITGAQIDLLIVRRDQVINLCEMKYSNSEYTLTEKTMTNLKNKIHSFKISTKTKYAIYPTIVTSYGLIQNSHSEIIQSVVTMKDLFQ